MKVSYDIISNDEIISDSFRITEVFGGVGGEVAARYAVRGAAVVDIGKYFLYFF